MDFYRVRRIGIGSSSPCNSLVCLCPRRREGTNIEVRVEIETQPRGGRQSSLSSILSSRSLSVESLGHSRSQSHDHPQTGASELGGRRGRGGEEVEVEGAESPAMEGTAYPVFDAVDSV